MVRLWKLHGRGVWQSVRYKQKKSATDGEKREGVLLRKWGLDREAESIEMDMAGIDEQNCWTVE